MRRRTDPASPASPARAGVDRVITCPGCGEATRYTLANAYRPFCSARCQGQDFGAWAGEHYVMSPPVDPQGDPGGE